MSIFVWGVGRIYIPLPGTGRFHHVVHHAVHAYRMCRGWA